MQDPWEHPDWYDLHDKDCCAGPERESEHYRECIIALPPLDRDDHLIDLGAGTGKLALMIAQGYPKTGRITLIDPNAYKLERALEKLSPVFPSERVTVLNKPVGYGEALPKEEATVVTVGSMLMPAMMMHGGTLADALGWLRNTLAEMLAILRPQGWLFDIETLAAPWEQGTLEDPARRLACQEFLEEYERAGFGSLECVYRFRDRIVLKAQKP
ncbi:class I SAM-dependent methyltransferase [candidate division KSB1 bacterium]